MNIRVVIGIPAFNESRTIGALIDSIMRDNFAVTTNVCVAIHDDCSTDGTPEILRRAHDVYGQKLHILSSDRRSGKSVGLNRLAAFAREAGSDFLCFLDGDVELGESSLLPAVRHLEACASNHIVVPLVIPRIGDLRFPLRDIFDFKARTQQYRMLYRPYVNGRAFAVRTSDFPTLPDDLVSEDRYLTLFFTAKRIVPCTDAIIYYRPPQTLLDLFRTRVKDQHRLIWLSKKHREHYLHLRNKRTSFFHTYMCSYPAEVRFRILRSLSCRSVLALAIERALTILSKVVGEITSIWQTPRNGTTAQSANT